MPIIGLIVALVPIIHGLFGGATLAVVLGGLTLGQWGGLAGAIAGVIFNEPKIEQELRTIHSAIDVLIDDIKAHGATVAAQKAHAKHSVPAPAPTPLPDPWNGGPPHGWA